MYRHRYFPWGISHLFILINVVAMVACSFGVIAKKYPEYSVFGLLGVVLAQGKCHLNLIQTACQFGIRPLQNGNQVSCPGGHR